LATSASKYTAGNPDRLDDVALEQATKSDECLAILPLELLISKQKQSPKRFGDSPPERSLTGGHKFLLQDGRFGGLAKQIQWQVTWVCTKVLEAAFCLAREYLHGESVRVEIPKTELG
jgi:hypothetical protein